MITPTSITYEATQAQTADRMRTAWRFHRSPRPGRVRSTGPSRRRTLARRLRLA
jgi:hypothetical protein